MKKLLGATLGVFLLASAAMADNDNIVNGRFETGDLTGWEHIGDVSVQTASLGDKPSQGTFQVLMTNGPDGSPYPEYHLPSFSGTNAVSLGLQELWHVWDCFATEGLTPHCLALYQVTEAGPYAMSGIKQTFTAKKDGFLSFDWNYLTDEGGYYADGAVFILDDQVWSIPNRFFTLPWIGEYAVESTPPVNRVSQSGTVFFGEFGYQHVTVPIPAGTHTFGFGIGEHLDTFFVSGLLIDNIKFTTGNGPTN
jgi:hypothetical protein